MTTTMMAQATRPSKDDLVEQIRLGKASYEIAEALGAHQNSVPKWFEFYSIPETDRPRALAKNLTRGLGIVPTISTPFDQPIRFALPGGGTTDCFATAEEVAETLDKILRKNRYA